MRTYLTLIGLGLSVTLSAQTIGDPVPDPLPSNGIGVQVESVARIPNSPGTGNAPRMNMIKEAPDGSGRLFVIEQRGYLYAILSDGTVVRYLDFNDEFGSAFLFDANQNGSTSFAFHPEYADNGIFYVVFSTPVLTGTPDFLAKRPIDPSLNGTDPRTPPFHDILVEFTATDPAANDFNGTHREMLRIEQPYDDHNVGEVAFNPNSRPGDPDYGMLYLAVADGGNKFPISDVDPENNGQDPFTILGTIIRIDPAGTNSANGKYGIPVDNPFADGLEALPEIWSYGHRNNHRLAWDTRGDQSLYTFEMGQALIEEVNRIVPGGNYGWGDREGTYLITESNELQLTAIPEDEEEGSFQYPVFQYDHVFNPGAIAGGAIYRGSAIPSLYGKVVISDFTSQRGAFYGMLSETEGLEYATAAPLYDLDVYTASGELADLQTAVLGSFGSRRTDLRIGTDLQGEIYFLNKRNGMVYRLVPSPAEPTFNVAIDESRFAAVGGMTVLSVNTMDTFDWKVEVDDAWIQLDSGPSFTGSASVEISVSPLPEGVDSRESHLVVSGKVIRISQSSNEQPPWEVIFPEGADLGSDYYNTAALGPVYIPAWPWIQITALGSWGWIYEDASDESGVWLYLPQF